MAEQVYEPQSESDEDCEVYFLKPVNEYNIVEKIKEANKELFADSTLGEKGDSGNVDSSSFTNISTNSATRTKIPTMRKVTFAPNLEDYEPENSKKSVIEEFSLEDDFPNSTKTELTKFPTIDEEEQNGALEDHTENDDGNSFSKSNEKSQMTTVSPSEIEINANSYSKVHDENDDDGIDEICEEIIVMEMESNISTTRNSMAPKDDSFSLQHRRAIMKQITFDCDEEDNKSLMNLLTASDGEEDDSRCTPKGIDNDDDDDDDANDSSIFNGIGDFDEDINLNARDDDDVGADDVDDDDDDDDDDDKLSLIVASYLPDDFERLCIKSPTSRGPSNSVGKSRSFFRRNCGKTTPCKSSLSSSSTTTSSSFSKRFQLRRKSRSTNSIGTLSSNSAVVYPENTPNSGGRKNGDVINLKLNYKTCCEYRNSIQGKLPKYTGYLSEYGLSREQLQQREHKLQKKQRFVLEQAIKTNDHDMQKMQDNERAFTTWLRNKMRFPINKTRNMFDVKFRFTGNRKTSIGNSSNGSFGNNNNSGSIGSAKVKTN